MIKELQDRVNRLRITNSKPVSFSFHCEVGAIINNDTENLTEMEQHDKILLKSEKMIFIP